jgi:hypothetical protein
MTPTRSSSSPDTHAAAWSFVLQHSQLIERMSARFFDKLKEEEREDARGDLMALLVERFPTLRLDDARDSKAVVVTWIGWQCLRVQKAYCRKHKKTTAREVTSVSGADQEETDVLVLMPAVGYGSHDAVESNVVGIEAEEMVAELYAGATPRQREAMMTVLADMTAPQMHAAFGLTLNARNDRLKTLRASVRAATTAP